MRVCRWASAAVLTVLLAGCSHAVVDGHPHTTDSSRHPSATASGGSSSPAAAPSTGAHVTDPAQARRITRDAAADVVAAGSYSYRTLGADLARGLARTTGGFRARYRKAFTTVVEPEARTLGATQSVRIDVVGLQTMPRTTRTQVLVALQMRTSRQHSAARSSLAIADVTLDLVNGRWLLSALRNGGGGGALGAVGSAGLTAAGNAADHGIVDITTFSRTHFAADEARALAATTGGLHRDLAAKQGATRAALTRLHADLRGVVTGVAVVTANGASATFLVTDQDHRSDKPASPTAQTLEVTVQLVGSSWLMSSVKTVGLH